MTTWDDFKKAIKAFESSIPHMSLATNGNVMVGVACMLPIARATSSLSLADRASIISAISGSDPGRLRGEQTTLADVVVNSTLDC